MSDTIYIFDIDGTLTPSRQLIDKTFAEFFLGWTVEGEKKVYFASGSDMKKIKEQLPEDILCASAGVFSCMGNQLWRDGKLEYQTSFIPDKTFFRDLDLYLEQGAKYKIRTGAHVEARAGMLNFSVVGRNATQEQREAYSRWDKLHHEREDFVEYITSRYPSLDASIGGTISVDVYPKGNDKSQVIDYLSSLEPAATYVFVGDKTDLGGNDYAIVEKLQDVEGSAWFKVGDWRDTQELINSNEVFA